MRAGGVAQQRVARHQVGVAVDGLFQAHAHVHAGQQVAPRVVEQGAHGHVVGAGVHRQVGEGQRAGAGVLGAVGQQQAHAQLVGFDALQLAVADLLLQAQHLGGRLGEVDVDRIDLLHHGQRRGLAFAHQRALGHQRARAVDGRGDARIVQLQLGALQVGARQRHLGAGLAFVGGGLGVVAFADGAVADQVGIAAQLVGRGGQAGLGARQVGGLGIVGGLQRRRVDLEQRVAALDVLAFLIEARGDDAGHPRAHFGFAVGLHPAGQFGGDGGGGGAGDDDPDLGGRLGFVLGLGFGTSRNKN